MDAHALFGIVAGLVALSAFPVYIHYMIRGNTRPNTATWSILTLSSLLLSASYYSAGARDTFWISLSYPLGCATISLLSLRYGYRKWTGFDRLCLVLALVSAGLWWIFHSPAPTLLINIGIDFLGILPTINKTYKRPNTESRSAWTLDVVASICAILAIEQWSPLVALYPIYLLVMNCVVVLLIFRKRHSWRVYRT